MRNNLFLATRLEDDAEDVLSPFSTSSTIAFASFLSSSVGSPILGRSGRLRSSLVSPESGSLRRLTFPVSGSAVKHCISVLLMKGTSMLCPAGQRSSYFLEVKMSKATMWHFAWPCFPVLEVDPM